jgi:bleomycin hydrolase
MKKIIFLSLTFCNVGFLFSQITPIINTQVDQTQEISPDASGVNAISGELFVGAKKNGATKVKDQERTNTCWSFATTSLVESQAIKNKLGAYDVSEMFTVRNIYIEKAKNYILRQGHTQFSEGGLGHDVIRSYASYGAVPDQVYNGLVNGEKVYDHQELFKVLKKYLDSTLKTRGRPLSADWLPGFNEILDKNMGPMPQEFVYNSRKYTPQSFAKTALKFNPSDYVNITSFTHHPFYSSFILEVPDNFSNGAYFNVPLNEMIDLVKDAVNSGYTVLWDADVSNNGFNAKKGMAINIKPDENTNTAFANPGFKEESYNQNTRQQLYENLTTQDDHLMHIVGIEKSKEGKTFFIVKNSWGETGPFGGYVHVSEAYFAMNTISLVVPKAAVGLGLREKLNVK